MRKNYYKIGEFSKLTGVSVKSLRYYEQVGALLPAYTDGETGYRYYIPEQMILLEVVKLCLAFHLPLKDMGGGATPPDLRRLIGLGEEKAREQLRETERLLRLSGDILSQIARLDIPRKEWEPYEVEFPARKILLLPWKTEREEGQDYVKKIAVLREKAVEKGLTVLTEQGIFRDAEQQKSYVFLAVEGNTKGLAARSFPAARYTCMILPEREMEHLETVGQSLGKPLRFAFCLNTDIYDFCLSHHPHMLEAQCLFGEEESDGKKSRAE